MSKLTVNASNLRNFGETRNGTFCLVTNPELVDAFSIDAGAGYSDSMVLPYSGEIAFGDFIRGSTPDNSHVLAILPNTYVKSPEPDQLGKNRKLAVMACSSTPTSLDAIRHFLVIAEQTDPAAQEAMAEDFFSQGQEAKALVFRNDQYGISATFEHLSDDLSWHEQIGALDWGQQQLIPAGEISVLPLSVFGQDINARFNLDGELAFRGYPVLHSGTPSYLPADQQRIFDDLATMERHAVIARVEGGRISDISASSAVCAPAVRILQSMFDVDSRYRSLIEIGFGINTALRLFPGNAAMNEVYGGRGGAIHFGIGLIPYTQYHLDIICPDTTLCNETGTVIFGRAMQLN